MLDPKNVDARRHIRNGSQLAAPIYSRPRRINRWRFPTSKIARGGIKTVLILFWNRSIECKRCFMRCAFDRSGSASNFFLTPFKPKRDIAISNCFFEFCRNIQSHVRNIHANMQSCNLDHSINQMRLFTQHHLCSTMFIKFKFGHCKSSG